MQKGELITLVCNLSLIDKGILLLVSFIFLLSVIFQVKSYLRKIDAAYVSALSDFAELNRIQAQKAGYVALHDLSFSWLRGVRMTVIPVRKRRKGKKGV
jgi:hypothetical protein